MKKIISIIGYSQEIAEVESIVTSNLVALRVERPFDMKVMVSNMEKLCEADEERRMGKHILLIDDDLAYLKMVQGWLLYLHPPDSAWPSPRTFPSI